MRDQRSLTCTYTTMRIPRIAIVYGSVFSVALNHFYDSSFYYNASRIGNAKSACFLGCVYAHTYGSCYMFTHICIRRTYTGWSA